MQPKLFKLFTATFIFFSISVFNAQTPTLYLIGDSTCSDYSASAYPRTGWGTTLGDYFDSSKVVVDNRAKSGRSSKSFYDEGSWAPVINAIGSGDFLIIQFGHNDEKSNDTDRYTVPYTTYQEYLKKYIDEARAKGAYPILTTSIHRNYWSGGLIKDSHGDYPPAMRALATEEDVPLVDAHMLSKALFESLGESYCTTEIFMNLEPGEYSNYPDGRSDDTHLQEEGAVKVSKEIAEALSELSQTHSYLSVFENVLGFSGIAHTRQEVDLKITNGQLRIKSDNTINHLLIADLSGRILVQKKNLNELRVNIESWSTGVYNIKSSVLGRNFTKKFAILR